MPQNQDPIVTLLIIYLTTPQTDLYLPKLIGGSSSPRLDPLVLSDIDLGSQNVLGLSMGMRLTNVVVTGLSNCQIPKTDGTPQVEVNGNAVTFDAVLPNTEAPPPNIPTVVGINAGFALQLPGGTSTTGSVAVQVKTSTLHGCFTATSDDGTAEKANLAFSTLGLRAELGANIVTQVQMDTSFLAIINSVCNKPNIQQMMLDKINSALADPGHLQALSQQATAAARSAAGKLG